LSFDKSEKGRTPIIQVLVCACMPCEDGIYRYQLYGHRIASFLIDTINIATVSYRALLQRLICSFARNGYYLSAFSNFLSFCCKATKRSSIEWANSLPPLRLLKLPLLPIGRGGEAKTPGGGARCPEQAPGGEGGEDGGGDEVGGAKGRAEVAVPHGRGT